MPLDVTPSWPAARRDLFGVRVSRKNCTVVFPSPLMSTIGELGAFLRREAQAAGDLPTPTIQPAPTNGEVVKT